MKATITLNEADLRSLIAEALSRRVGAKVDPACVSFTHDQGDRFGTASTSCSVGVDLPEAFHATRSTP